jgi:hypothetical protein
MNYLGVLRDKIGRLRVEIASIQELNAQFRHAVRNDTVAQVAHGRRQEGESWTQYCHRSCSEVMNGFQRVVSATDFMKEASSNWPSVQINPTKSLVFVAYFVTESDPASRAR